MKIACAACGEAYSEHSINGACYGKCGSFVTQGSRGSWTRPKVVDQPKFGAASQYVVARLDEISERLDLLAEAALIFCRNNRSAEKQ